MKRFLTAVWILILGLSSPLWAESKADRRPEEHCVYISGATAFCKDPNTGHQTRRFDMKNRKIHGYQQVYDPKNGNLLAKEHYDQDQLKGRQEYYNAQGKVEREEFHEPGKKPTVLWYSRFPTKISKISCGDPLSDTVANHLCGYPKAKSHKIYNPEGQVLRRENFWKGKPHGLQEILDPTGRVVERHFYDQGQVAERLEEFNEVGKRVYLYEKANHKETFYYPKGLVKAENSLGPTGLIKKRQVYYLNGFVKEEWHHMEGDLYVQKKYDGVTAKVLSQGKLRALNPEELSTHKREGLWKLFNKEGQLEYEITYLEGVMKERKTYDSEGSLKKTETFYADGSIKEVKEGLKTIAY